MSEAPAVCQSGHSPQKRLSAHGKGTHVSAWCPTSVQNAAEQSIDKEPGG